MMLSIRVKGVSPILHATLCSFILLSVTHVMVATHTLLAKCLKKNVAKKKSFGKKKRYRTRQCNTTSAKSKTTRRRSSTKWGCVSRSRNNLCRGSYNGCCLGHHRSICPAVIAALELHLIELKNQVREIKLVSSSSNQDLRFIKDFVNMIIDEDDVLPV